MISLRWEKYNGSWRKFFELAEKFEIFGVQIKNASFAYMNRNGRSVDGFENLISVCYNEMYLFFNMLSFSLKLALLKFSWDGMTVLLYCDNKRSS